MSLLSKAFRSISRRVKKAVPKEIRRVAPALVGGAIGGPIGASLGGLVAGAGSAPKVQYVTLPSAGVVPMQSSLAISPTVIKRGVEIGAGVGAGVIGGMLAGDQKRKYRRMNYGNMKAARRAIRRIKGARKMLQEIERQLPKQRTSRRCPPQRSYGGGRKGVEIVNVD